MHGRSPALVAFLAMRTDQTFVTTGASLCRRKRVGSGPDL